VLLAVSTKAMVTVMTATTIVGVNTMAVIAVVRAAKKTSFSIARVAHVLTLQKHRSLLTAKHAREHAVLQNTKVMAIAMMETIIADASMTVETAAERAVMG